MHLNLNLNLLLLTLTSLLLLTDAISLTQYKKSNCRGKATICRNIKEKVCCVPRSTFVSGACRGCKDKNTHITWTKRGMKKCGKKAASTHGKKCISGGKKLSGHSWCKKCPRKVVEMEEADIMVGGGDVGYEYDYDYEAECTETVEPDVLRIGDIWYDVNEEVAGVDRDALWNLWSEEMEEVVVPQALLKYQTRLNETNGPDEEVPGEDDDDTPDAPDEPDAPEKPDDFE